MKSLLTFIMLLLGLLSFSQKKSNLFLDAGIFFHSGTEMTYVGSFVYNYAPTQMLGVGIGLEVTGVNINSHQAAAIAPRLDVRYYIKSGKTLFFPVAQLGYSLYSKEQNRGTEGSNVKQTAKGGAQYSVGIGVGRAASKNSGGLFGLLRYAQHYYESESFSRNVVITGGPNPRRFDLNGGMLTIGYRF